MLFALTFALMEFDVWMYDHEVEFLQEIRPLLTRFAKEWKATLGKPDAALGIDAEFTRPGAVAVVEKFQREVERIDTCGFAPPIKFKWR